MNTAERKIHELLSKTGYQHVDGHKRKTDVSKVYIHDKGTKDIKAPHNTYITVSLEDNYIHVYREPHAGNLIYPFNYSFYIDILDVKDNFKEFKDILYRVVKYY